MTHIYQGVDIVDISKFKKVFLRHKDFISDVFTEREQGYCMSGRNPYMHFAGRFAAKEAALKALGIGMSGSGIDSALKEIEILSGASGKPVLSFNGWAEKISKKKGIRQLTVSISHSSDYAIATAILVGSLKSRDTSHFCS